MLLFILPLLFPALIGSIAIPDSDPSSAVPIMQEISDVLAYSGMSAPITNAGAFIVQRVEEPDGVTITTTLPGETELWICTPSTPAPAPTDGSAVKRSESTEEGDKVEEGEEETEAGDKQELLNEFKDFFSGVKGLSTEFTDAGKHRTALVEDLDLDLPKMVTPAPYMTLGKRCENCPTKVARSQPTIVMEEAISSHRSKEGCFLAAKGLEVPVSFILPIPGDSHLLMQALGKGGSDRA